MKKKLLKQAFLLAVCLLVGTNASWAGDITIPFEKGYTTAWTDGDATAWTGTTGDEYSVTKSDAGIVFALSAADNGRYAYEYAHTFTSTADSKVNLKALWSAGSPTGKVNANNSYIDFGGVKLRLYGQNSKLTIQIGTADAVDLMVGSANDNNNTLRSKDFNVDITINKKTGAVIYSVSCSAWNSGTPVTGAGSLESPAVTSFKIGYDRGGQQLKSFSQTLKSINISYQYAYTINAKNGDDVIEELGSGFGSPDSEIDYAYQRYYNINGTLYQADASDGTYAYKNSFTLSQDDQEENIAYTATSISDVVFYSEAENLTTSSYHVTAGNLSTQGSGAKGAASSGNNVTNTPISVTTLPIGKYKVTARIGGKGSQTHRVKAGDTEILSYTTTNGYLIERTSDAFTLAAETAITYEGGYVTTTAGNAQGLDYIYFQKLYDTSDLAAVSATKTIYLGDDTWTLAQSTDYTTSSTGAITLTSSDPTVASVTGMAVTPVAAGTATITISQARDNTYEAKSVTIALTVAEKTVATPDFTIASYNYEQEGYAITPTCTTEGVTFKYKIGNGSWQNATVPFYAKGGKLYLKAEKDGWTSAETPTSKQYNLSGAPSSTSPETLISFQTSSDDGDKNIEHAYKSVTIAGGNSGAIGGIAPGETGKLKLRTNQSDNTITLNVNEGYVVTKVSMKANSNNTGAGATIDLTSVTIDGGENIMNANTTFPISSADAVEYNTGNINATSALVFTFDNINIGSETGKKNKQILAEIKVWYKTPTEIAIENAIAHFNALKDYADALVAVANDNASANSTLSTAISTQAAAVASATTIDAITTATSTLLTAMNTYVAAANPTAGNQFDLTYLLTDPNGETYTAWGAAGNFGYNTDIPTTGVGTYNNFVTRITSEDGWAQSKNAVERYTSNVYTTANTWALYQKVTLPAGNYSFDAYALANDASTIVMAAGDAEGDAVTAANLTAYTVDFTLASEAETKMGLKISATGTNACNWMAITEIKLYKEAGFSVSGTIPSSGYGSLASAYGLDFGSATVSSGTLTAYVVTQTTNELVKITSVDELPANQGVILKGTPGATYNIPVKADAAYAGANLLSAAVTATDIVANTAYILQSGEFHLVTADSKVPAGKAYLLASNVPSGARAMKFVFDDDATAVFDLNDKSEMINDNYYDLQGRRVSQPTKGLYIKNGRKVVVK